MSEVNQMDRLPRDWMRYVRLQSNKRLVARLCAPFPYFLPFLPLVLRSFAFLSSFPVVQDGFQRNHERKTYCWPYTT